MEKLKEKLPVLSGEQLGKILTDNEEQWDRMEHYGDHYFSYIIELIAQDQRDHDVIWFQDWLEKEIDKSLLTPEDISEELNRLSPDEGEREFFRAVTLLATRTGILGSLLEVQIDKVLRVAVKKHFEKEVKNEMPEVREETYKGGA